jgi:DnaJ-class molecular chaperone
MTGETSQTDKPGDEASPGTPGSGEALCPRCSGSGQVEGGDCPVCDGTGVVNAGVGGG